jgi:hypothetical protein
MLVRLEVLLDVDVVELRGGVELEAGVVQQSFELLPAAAEAGVDFAQPFRPEFTNTKPNF